MKYTNTQILEILNKYKWYHSIPINDDISTPGTMNPQTNTLKYMQSICFQDKKVLDIGCRDAKFCFEAEKRGAKRIVGIDNCISLGARDFLIPFFNSKVELVEQSLYDLDIQEHGTFDIVIFIGVLYHLKYPFYALKKIADIMTTNSIMILETAIWNNTDNKALLYCPTIEESPYGGSSPTFFNYRGLEDNLKIFGFDNFEYMPNIKKDNDKISRLTVKCQKIELSKQNLALHNYWVGNNHTTWHKKDI